MAPGKGKLLPFGIFKSFIPDESAITLAAPRGT